MQHVSTPLARTLGAAALLSAAVAWGAAAFQYDPHHARLDILVPLGLAAVFVVGWLVACRAAPLVEPMTVAGSAREAIPGTLGTVRRDWGLAATAYLVVWAPFAAANSAYGGRGSQLGAVYCLLTFIVGVVTSVCLLSLFQSYLGPMQRMLKEDAAKGAVHAVRVRFGTPVLETYRYPTGQGLGKIAASTTYGVELVPEGESDGQRTVRLQAMQAGHSRAVGNKHLANAVAQLGGHSGWLCWPTRWKDIAGTNKERLVPAAFVSDSGLVVWGQTKEEDYEPFLRDGAAPLRETDPALAVAPLPRPARYLPGVHASHLRIAAVGALFALPFLLDVVPDWAALLLGVVSGALGLLAGMTLDSVRMDPEPWTVRTTSHPSLQ
ncbi:hypothetical protein [Streptomyces sp. MBT62]|uniref:hypothetical protein n=1 Tax=Streptomyces sp. MBT62 TaxID=2800410 RepID=UPI00190B2DD5|nr:hypothetical protein [Streptomyces sp. MBT62]MBK3567495.1 hypothetical protein [Streptomyces sp. MBT62]